MDITDKIHEIQHDLDKLWETKYLPYLQQVAHGLGYPSPEALQASADQEHLHCYHTLESELTHLFTVEAHWHIIQPRRLYQDSKHFPN